MASNPLNIFEYEQRAKRHLPKANYDYIAGGATDEITLERTRAAFDSIVLRPRMLVNVEHIDTSTTVMGQALHHPIMLDPAGSHGRAHLEAELATARAAGAEGALMVLSSRPSYAMEQVAQAASGPIWLQQPLYKDRGWAKELAEHAKEAGFSAICVTLDTKVNAKRERNIRNEQLDIRMKDYTEGLHRSFPAKAKGSRDPSATWEYLDWLVSNIPLPVVVKGIMTGEDARLCPEHGVNGIIVSNHGARQLDSTFATIEVLPEVVEAVDGLAEVYLDGGIRRGSDVVKALALGARAVLIGRPYLWGLAADGEAGVRSVIRILREETEMTMALCGRPTIDSIDRTLVGTTSPLLQALSHTEEMAQI